MARKHPAYGVKRDYPKIEIHGPKGYLCTTTWARTCREAVARYREAMNVPADKPIRAYFKHSPKARKPYQPAA